MEKEYKFGIDNSTEECQSCKTLKKQLDDLKASKILCCSCRRNEVEIKGMWCESCKTHFAYGA